jgi:hypothetical protein
MWRKCNSCKKPIGFRTKYWVCSVSTCTRKRTGLVFCSVSCWDAHAPMMNHRDAGAIEMMSPSQAEWEREQDPTLTKEEKHMMENETSAGEGSGGEVLVVASKLKNYIREKAGMNTSAAVMEALSNKLRQLCDLAIENAKREGRKTVMDRDFQ